MDSEKVIKRDNEYVLHTYNRNPIALEKGLNDNVTIKTNTSKEIFDYGLHRSVQARRHGTAD